MQKGTVEHSAARTIRSEETVSNAVTVPEMFCPVSMVHPPCAGGSLAAMAILARCRWDCGRSVVVATSSLGARESEGFEPPCPGQPAGDAASPLLRTLRLDAV